jgi:hypothetical protein
VSREIKLRPSFQFGDACVGIHSGTHASWEKVCVSSAIFAIVSSNKRQEPINSTLRTASGRQTTVSARRKVSKQKQPSRSNAFRSTFARFPYNLTNTPSAPTPASSLSSQILSRGSRNMARTPLPAISSRTPIS